MTLLADFEAKSEFKVPGRLHFAHVVEVVAYPNKRAYLSIRIHDLKQMGIYVELEHRNPTQLANWVPRGNSLWARAPVRDVPQLRLLQQLS